MFMATAIIQVDVEELSASIAVPRSYVRALIILRRKGQPVGRFELPVTGDRVDESAFAQGLFSEVRRSGQWWLWHDYLGEDPVGPLPDATVAICTRERPDDLRYALTALLALNPAPREILVVDNNPVSKSTREVAAAFPSVRYICHTPPGLDSARNRALREAATEIVAFTDDDAAPEPAWLGALLRPFVEPRVWCTTGLTLPRELETPAQEWFERYSPFSRGFRRRVFDGMVADPLAVGPVGAGANMAVRRRVLTDLGGFDEALDAGTVTCSGGDHEMFGRILSNGYRIVYEPAAVSWHRHRRTWTELRDTVRGYGVGVYAMWTRRLLREHDPGVLRHAAVWLVRTQAPALWRALRRRPNAVPLDLIWAEVIGCMIGPAAYVRSVLHRSRTSP
jgi:GT2 family glycosyltransferase